MALLKVTKSQLPDRDYNDLVERHCHLRLAAIGMLGVTENCLIPKGTPGKGGEWWDGLLLWTLVEISLHSV